MPQLRPDLQALIDQQNADAAAKANLTPQDFMNEMEGIMIKEMQGHEAQLDATKCDYWLVFRADEGNREDCNTYYSTLVLAPTRQEAWDKYMTARGLTAADRDRYDVQPMPPIT